MAGHGDHVLPGSSQRLFQHLGQRRPCVKLRLPADSIVSAPGTAAHALNGHRNRLGEQNVFVESNLLTVCSLHTTLLLPALYNKLNSDSIKNVCVMRRLFWKTRHIYLLSTSTSFLQSRRSPTDLNFRECPGKWGFSYLELSVECQSRTEPLGPSLFSSET